MEQGLADLNVALVGAGGVVAGALVTAFLTAFWRRSDAKRAVVREKALTTLQAMGALRGVMRRLDAMIDFGPQADEGEEVMAEAWRAFEHNIEPSLHVAAELEKRDELRALILDVRQSGFTLINVTGHYVQLLGAKDTDHAFREGRREKAEKTLEELRTMLDRLGRRLRKRL